MDSIRKGGVAIIDFGSQYTKLIARRIRENSVYSEILSPDTKINVIMKNCPAAIILSGGPKSVNDNDAPTFDKKLLVNTLIDEKYFNIKKMNNINLK